MALPSAQVIFITPHSMKFKTYKTFSGGALNFSEAP